MLFVLSKSFGFKATTKPPTENCLISGFWTVRKLGIFMLKLIQRSNSKFVMTNKCTRVILLLLRLAANIFMNNILIIAKKRLNLTNLRMEMYPVEGPMLKASVALVPLMMSCLKSRTTVGAGRCT